MECEVQGIPIHYETVGEGRPFLALHGGGRDYRHMQELLEPIFAVHPGWQRIYPDLPGHGSTPAPGWLVNHDQLLDILLGFIDQVIPGGSFALAGLSRGGYLARGILARRPGAVTGLLLIIPANGFRTRTPLPGKVVLVKDESALAGMTPLESELLDIFVVQNRKALEDVRHGLPAIELADRAFKERILKPENYDFTFDVEQMPAIFDKPALVLAGRQDWMVGFQAAVKMVEQFPRGTLAVLDRAGHALPVEQNELLQALAVEWLQRVEKNLPEPGQ